MTQGVLPVGRHRATETVLPNGWVFVGETSKWVPTSSTHFTALDAADGSNCVNVSLNCAHAQAEVVSMVALRPAHSEGGAGAAEWVVETVEAACPTSGEAVICRGSC